MDYSYIILIFLLLFAIRHIVISSYVTNNSDALKSIKALNNKYLFKVVSKRKIYQPLKSLKTFKNYNPQLALMSYINQDYICETFDSFIKDSKSPVFMNKDDITGLAQLFSNGVCKNEQKKYSKEKSSIVVNYFYTSPKGKNQYKDAEFYSVEDIYNIRYKVLKKEYVSAARANERALLTSSMRYDVLKRDNFQCQICGHSKNDGVKLHVDHIKPIAKGGKTQMSNLRTLCEDCNIGKSDKYVVGEIN